MTTVGKKDFGAAGEVLPAFWFANTAYKVTYAMGRWGG